MSTTRPSGPKVAPGPEGTFFVEARAPLDEVSTAVGFDFAALADAEDVDTIGGLITAVAGRVPVRGEIISGFGRIRIRGARRRRAPRQAPQDPSSRRKHRKQGDKAERGRREKLGRAGGAGGGPHLRPERRLTA